MKIYLIGYFILLVGADSRCGSPASFVSFRRLARDRRIDRDRLRHHAGRRVGAAAVPTRE
jgi:hypothetical protein